MWRTKLLGKDAESCAGCLLYGLVWDSLLEVQVLWQGERTCRLFEDLLLVLNVQKALLICLSRVHGHWGVQPWLA